MIEIVPHLSIGPVRFRERIDLFLEKFDDFDYHLDDDNTIWDEHYFLNRDLVVYTENDLVICAGIFCDCYLEGRNLFGMNIGEFFATFNISEKERSVDERLWVSDTEQQSVYEIQSLGLELWVNDHQNIVGIMASPVDE